MTDKIIFIASLLLSLSSIILCVKQLMTINREIKRLS